MKHAITINEDHFEALRELPDAELVLLVRALMADVDGQAPKDDLPPMAALIKRYIDRQNARLSEKQRQNVTKRWSDTAEAEAGETIPSIPTLPNDTNDTSITLTKNPNPNPNRGNTPLLSPQGELCVQTLPQKKGPCGRHATVSKVSSFSVPSASAGRDDPGAQAPGNGAKRAFGEFVTLTEQEHASLLETHGEEGAKWMIARLDNYKGASGKKYKSDYRAILSWVAEEYERHRQQAAQRSRAAPYDPEDRFANLRALMRELEAEEAEQGEESPSSEGVFSWL